MYYMVAPVVKNLPASAGDTETGSISGKIPWSRKWQHSAVILAWEIPWIEEPGRLQSMGSQKSDTTEHTHVHIICVDFV